MNRSVATPHDPTPPLGEQLTLSLGAEMAAAEGWRLVDAGEAHGVPARILDVPESIPALGYGSHQFFRYYGKFPSIVGREIIERFPPASGPVLDCFNGSGTTLVEAQIAGHESLGIDINPLSVLASNVKTGYYDPKFLRASLVQFLADVEPDNGWRPSSRNAAWLDKWFPAQVQSDLSSLHEALAAWADHPAYDFLSLAYLAIVRRVSHAFDGEVRPHVNKAKVERSVFKAFERKFMDSVDGLIDLDKRRQAGTKSRAVVGDNRDAAVYADLMQGRRAGLVVAHPPYLNSFNYLAVFSLEFAWSEGMPAVWNTPYTEKDIRRLEQRAHPATDENLRKGYYVALSETLKAATSSAASGATVAVVVGDATIHGVLEPVHLNVWKSMQEDGLEPLEIWYRTTHYGIGKYAYSTRADYHGEAQKKDAILFARVP